MPRFYKSGDYRRTFEISKDSVRTEFRRDFSRLIHSPSFRRLQGKTQLYPGKESDFFRSRITHSIEVAQIGKSIALMINQQYTDVDDHHLKIDTDLVELACLAHDLGHPPFGHIGEAVLDELMKNDGGFEGNAQTLRILAKIEKKHEIKNTVFGIRTGGKESEIGDDLRVGLNLTYRSLASILKYDYEIPLKNEHRKEGQKDKVVKGYYSSERDLVRNIKEALTGKKTFEPFKTIECQIMDLADDIAYSTYDLEDAFKAGFVKPLDLLCADEELLERVANKVSNSTNEDLNAEDILNILSTIFSQITNIKIKSELEAWITKNKLSYDLVLYLLKTTYRTSNNLANDGYKRVEFTGALIDKFIKGVRFKYDSTNPCMSKVYFTKSILKQVEVLKTFTYESQIVSPRLKIVEYRGKEIVRKIFETLTNPEGYKLLPHDFRMIYDKINPKDRMRIICDFICGMTDRYALEFYGRLVSENPETIFKPY